MQTYAKDSSDRKISAYEEAKEEARRAVAPETIKKLTQHCRDALPTVRMTGLALRAMRHNERERSKWVRNAMNGKAARSDQDRKGDRKEYGEHLTEALNTEMQRLGDTPLNRELSRQEYNHGMIEYDRINGNAT